MGILFTPENLRHLLVMTITSALATLGFSLLFKLNYNRLLWSTLGGVLTCLCYEITVIFGGTMLLAAFLSSLFMALYSEFSARYFRAPSFIFLLPCAIPIVPGSYMYYSFYHLFTGNQELAMRYIKGTAQIGLGIAIGLSFSSIFLGMILQLIKIIQQKKAKKQQKETN